MCIRKLIHRLACDSRPLFTTAFDGMEAQVIVNPFGEPPCCNLARCPANRDAPELPIREQCLYHDCCRVAAIDLRCPEDCCPEQREKKGRLEDGISGLVSGPSYRNKVTDCKHFAQFHVYIMDVSRSVGFGDEWRKASCPYPELVTDNAVHGPKETVLFRQARANLLRAGERLLAAKDEKIALRKKMDSLDEERVVPKGVMGDLRERLYIIRSGGIDMEESYDDCLELVKLLEQQGHGSLEGYPFKY